MGNPLTMSPSVLRPLATASRAHVYPQLPSPTEGGLPPFPRPNGGTARRPPNLTVGFTSFSLGEGLVA